jgi:LTXXQ motif family protein
VGIIRGAVAYCLVAGSLIESKRTEDFVNKTILAVALAASAAVAAPVVTGLAQNANPPAAPEAAPPAGGGAPMPMMRGGPMMHRMWMRRAGMGAGNPQERCIDRLARRAAHRAYVETKLDLTAAQRPLWDRVETVAQQEEQQQRRLCATLPTTRSTTTTVVERMDRMQQFLAARLAGLRAAEPAVSALYQALTPAQRTILDHPFRRS